MTTQQVQQLDQEYRDIDTLEDMSEQLSERDLLNRIENEARLEVPEWIALGLQK
jgi:hypothetical protein